MRHDDAEQAGVAVVEGVEAALDGSVELVVDAAVDLAQAEPLAAEHGGEAEGAGGGDDHHDGDHPAELAEEHARHARHQGEGEEYGYQRECGGDDGDGDLVGAVHGRLSRVGAALDVRGDVLQDHDGVVDDHADGDAQRRKRHDVEGVAGGV